MAREEPGKEGSLREQRGRGEEEEKGNQQQDTCYKKHGSVS